MLLVIGVAIRRVVLFCLGVIRRCVRVPFFSILRLVLIFLDIVRLIVFWFIIWLHLLNMFIFIDWRFVSFCFSVILGLLLVVWLCFGFIEIRVKRFYLVDCILHFVCARVGLLRLFFGLLLWLFRVTVSVVFRKRRRLALWWQTSALK